MKTAANAGPENTIEGYVLRNKFRHNHNQVGTQNAAPHVRKMNWAQVDTPRPQQEVPASQLSLEFSLCP